MERCALLGLNAVMDVTGLPRGLFAPEHIFRATPQIVILLYYKIPVHHYPHLTRLAWNFSCPEIQDSNVNILEKIGKAEFSGHPGQRKTLPSPGAHFSKVPVTLRARSHILQNEI